MVRLLIQVLAFGVDDIAVFLTLTPDTGVDFI